MSEFFKTSTIWTVEFRYDGHPRRWIKAFGPREDVAARMADTLRELFGERVQQLQVRRATPDEEMQYLRGEQPDNMLCPTGRHP